MSARSQVDSLLAIIKEAAYNALDQYDKTGLPTPTLDSIETHPLDVDDNNLQLKKIVSTVEGACAQLCTLLAPPSHTIMNRAQDFGWACLRVAVTQKFADVLSGYPEGLHVNELSRKVNVHPMKLASILRVLSAKHCFREVSPDIFANNRLSINLTSDQSLSALVDLITEEGQGTAIFLSDYLVDPAVGQSLSMSKAVFQYRNRDKYNEGITYYDWLQLKESQERRKVMMKAMVSMNSVVGSLAALHVYSWENIRSVCDVGSGLGGFSRSLLESYRNLKVTQFDLPKTLEVARQHWKQDFADRNKFVSGDFLVEIPVKGCDVYYLRNILHNWTDEKALIILKSVRQAMGLHSRVLVHDHLLRHTNSTPGLVETDGLDVAPQPMLANYGAGHIRLYHQDLTMMMMYNTKERTVAEIANLGKAANLRVNEIYDLAEMCLVEFGVAEDGGQVLHAMQN